MSTSLNAVRRIVITGCSGGGKSTLLAELARRGFAVVPEPGRRIVEAEPDPASPRLPWNDLACFAEAATALALADFERTGDAPGPTFFDRGLLDALLARAHATGEAVPRDVVAAHRYERTVFFAPPWPEIYASDAQRRHDFAEAVAEAERLRAAYPAFGYRLAVLPKVAVAARADMVLATLELSSGPRPR